MGQSAKQQINISNTWLHRTRWHTEDTNHGDADFCLGNVTSLSWPQFLHSILVIRSSVSLAELTRNLMREMWVILDVTCGLLQAKCDRETIVWIFHGARNSRGHCRFLLLYSKTLHLVTYKWNSFVSHVSGAEKSLNKPMADFLWVSAGPLFLIFIIFVS
jgi:hypothetical protein